MLHKTLLKSKVNALLDISHFTDLVAMSLEHSLAHLKSLTSPGPCSQRRKARPLSPVTSVL
jgi:hypothetical protein